jgi:hypothetical protein
MQSAKLKNKGRHAMADHSDLKHGGIDRSTDEIREDIAAKRDSISQTVGRLGDKIQETLDWKVYVRRYPYMAVGAAVGTGLLLAATLPRRKATPMERILDVLVDKAEELGDDLLKSARRLAVRTVAPGLFRGTIYGLAGKAFMQYLQNRVILAEGNGANLTSEMEWKRSQQSTSTTSNY